MNHKRGRVKQRASALCEHDGSLEVSGNRKEKTKQSDRGKCSVIPLADSEKFLSSQVGPEAPTGQESQDAHHCLCGEPCGGQREGRESKGQLGKLGGTHLGIGSASP